MKYFRLKFFIFIIKNTFYRLRYGNSIMFTSFKVGLEEKCIIIIKDNGEIKFGNMNYFSRFTNIETYGGVIDIGDNVSFNKNCNIISRGKIKIGDNCIFGPNVSLYDHNHGISVSQNMPFFQQEYAVQDIRIGSNVWIGANVTILSGVNIGNNVVVGANSVVTHILDDNGIYAGIPAKRIGDLTK